MTKTSVTVELNNKYKTSRCTGNRETYLWQRICFEISPDGKTFESCDKWKPMAKHFVG